MKKVSANELRLPSIFGSGMVLQHGKRIPVWGWSAPGDRITVEFAEQRKMAVAGPDGAWRLILKPLAVSGKPQTMTVSAAHIARRTSSASRVLEEPVHRLQFGDILVGDVWVCSGQSNMEWVLASSQDAIRETAAADYPNIRLFTVPRKASLCPPQDIAGAWERCTPDNAGSFSAVAYFFGREVHHRTGIPIGLINTSWGGTIAETWVSREGLANSPVFRKVVKEYESELRHPETVQQAARERIKEWAAKYDIKDKRNQGEAAGWHKPEADTTGWKDMEVPGNWQSAGHRYSGVFWFRLDVEIPAKWQGRDLTLSLGAIDKSDVTYFNGVRVGSITMEQRPDAWCTPRVYIVPGKQVKAGNNVIAVRVFSNIYEGGFIGVPRQMCLLPADDKTAQPIFLAGVWRYKIESNFGLIPAAPPLPRGEGNSNSPYMLFNNMLRPLLPYAVQGAIWYQGESNADRAYQYRTLLPLLIRDWRKEWRCGRFPFLIVQLANYNPPAKSPGESVWAELREAQFLTAKNVPGCGLAVTIDIGDANDIHPRNKQDVGLRLALQALNKVYGNRKLVCDGPVYQGMVVKGDSAVIRFHVPDGSLLTLDGKALRGFAVAGADRQFYWAEARIARNTVVVRCDKIKKPVAVRYGWANNSECNLGNKAGLPAAPFRSDKWPYSTRNASV